MIRSQGISVMQEQPTPGLLSKSAQFHEKKKVAFLTTAGESAKT
jgi:hypothetical protein